MQGRNPNSNVHTYTIIKRLAFMSSLISIRNFSSSPQSFADALNVCILVGSTREDGPPRPILANRVAKFVEASVKRRQTQHNISILDAKDLGLLKKPHFSYAKSQIPQDLEDMYQKLKEGDAYITITPEYNHAPCPGLLNLMNHFGSSVFSFKPSGIVSYSAGQWGGTRAAHSLRPFLSELGCIPVSAMIHIPHAMNVLDEDGNVIISTSASAMESDKEERWIGYCDRMIHQLEFWGQAAKRQREIEDPSLGSPAFVKKPSERNAPQ